MNTQHNSDSPISELDKLDYSIREMIKHYRNLKLENAGLVEELRNLKKSYAALHDTHNKVEQRVKNLLTRLVALEE